MVAATDKKPTSVQTEEAPEEIPAAQVLLIKKREQIARINRKMFLWVAAGSVVVSFAIVASLFLGKQLLFNEKVLAEKGKTIHTLQTNVENAKELHSAVNNLRADRNLTKARAPGSKNNLDVVLDALPYEGDSISLGSSLQNRLLNGITVDSLSVSSVETSEPSDAGGVAAPEVSPAVPAADPTALAPVSLPAGTQIITFDFKVTASPIELTAMMEKLDRSIRPVKLSTVSFAAASQGKLEMTAHATTYYLPKKTFELKEKTIKP